MSTKADRLHAAPETIKQSNDVHPSSPQEREVLTALKEFVQRIAEQKMCDEDPDECEDDSGPYCQTHCRFWDSDIEEARALIAKAESAPSVGQQESETRFHSCHCPAKKGEDCPLTLDECEARQLDYLGGGFFAQRLRRVYDGFVRESMNGVVCSIPDTGLDTPPHRKWCAHCQRRWMELKALVEMMERAVMTGRTERSHQSAPDASGAESTAAMTNSSSVAAAPASAKEDK